MAGPGPFRLKILASAKRDLKDLPPEIQARVAEALRQIQSNPKPGPPGYKSLKGQHKGYERWRVGSHRIIYRVDADNGAIKVGRIALRKSVYSIAPAF